MMGGSKGGRERAAAPVLDSVRSTEPVPPLRGAPVPPSPCHCLSPHQLKPYGGISFLRRNATVLRLALEISQLLKHLI